MTLKELADKTKASGVLSVEIEFGDTNRVIVYGRREGAPDYACKSKEARASSTSLELAIERAIDAFTGKGK